MELWQKITWLDLAVFLAIYLGTLLAVWGGRKSPHSGTDVKDYVLMGRKISLPFLIATIVATWYGGIFGVSQIAFEKGLFSLLTQGIFWYIAAALFAWLVIPHLAKADSLSLEDYIGTRVGKHAGRLVGIFNFIDLVPVAYVIGLGLFLQAFTGLNLYLCIIIGILLMSLYSFTQGLRAVVLSDSVQAVVMVLAVFLLAVVSVNHYGGLDYLRQNLPDYYFSFSGDETYSEIFIWGFVALSTLVEPNFYHRFFASRSVSQFRWAIAGSIAVWFFFDMSLTVGAMYARAALGENANSGTAYLDYAAQVLPSGFLGFFLAGIMATILSTMDSYTFLAGRCFAGRDLRIATHRIGMVVCLVLAAGLAWHFEGSIKKVWKLFASFSSACLFFPILTAVIWGLAEKVFLASVLGAVFVIILCKTTGYEFFHGIEFYLGAVVTLVIIGGSWLRRRLLLF